MDRNQYEMKLREWHSEFCDIAQKQIELPEYWFSFMTGRLQEAGLAEEIPDVVRATIQDKLRRVKITGRHGPRILYDLADGIGTGMIRVADVHPEDNSKLAAILDRIEGTR